MLAKNPPEIITIFEQQDLKGGWRWLRGPGQVEVESNYFCTFRSSQVPPTHARSNQQERCLQEEVSVPVSVPLNTRDV
jgi:hypothetical protein